MKTLGKLIPAMGLLTLVTGCGGSDDSAQAGNGITATAQAVAAPVEAAPPPSPMPVRADNPGQPVKAANPIVTVCAHPAPYFPLDLPPSDVAADAAPFPQEVTQFMVDRDSCDHFRGEEAYDAERRAYIAENIAELCHGSDAKLAMLRKRYSSDPSVIAALKGYEAHIEAPESY